MNLLLDTQIFIWADQDKGKLSAAVQSAMEDRSNLLFISTASICEMQIKVQLGKLSIRKPLADLIEEYVSRDVLRVVPVYPEHTYALQQLPPLHRDPFDRLIVATALVEHSTILSVDEFVKQYAVPVIG
ncbi:PIN domain nuclease, a component of toxin-antitoxin system (PIN domain) [Prosthecobacter debontii]|uniref:PIN domain nuclease, a component of toxin-antitoxin system (PIN domain) n=2 Tax=Prosthecobacter debontii TaxID=48467 RepID=A0A1T4YWC2_9BACT|nr:PIN domain nuclease, a component of toxin-antitoxin system (PIN domain) [Prosthecobacter debontii]